jgi:hypothetical protein
MSSNCTACIGVSIFHDKGKVKHMHAGHQRLQGDTFAFYRACVTVQTGESTGLKDGKSSIKAMTEAKFSKYATKLEMG